MQYKAGCYYVNSRESKEMREFGQYVSHQMAIGHAKELNDLHKDWKEIDGELDIVRMFFYDGKLNYIWETHSR